MSYVCVSINKEVVNKETFTNKQQAVAYFQKLHGKKIREEKKAKKEAELEQLCHSMDKVEVTYEAKYNGYKDNLFTQEPQLILHISGIYQNGYQFTVIEEKYYYIGAKIDTDKTIYSVLKELPSQFDKNRISLYVFNEIDDSEKIVEQDNLDRIQKTVTRIRNQILRNFQNGPTRLKLV